jgi:hypothetical protein
MTVNTAYMVMPISGDPTYVHELWNKNGADILVSTLWTDFALLYEYMAIVPDYNRNEGLLVDQIQGELSQVYLHKGITQIKVLSHCEDGDLPDIGEVIEIVRGDICREKHTGKQPFTHPLEQIGWELTETSMILLGDVGCTEVREWPFA